MFQVYLFIYLFILNFAFEVNDRFANSSNIQNIRLHSNFPYKAVQ